MATDTSETSSEDKKFSRTLESFNKVVDPSLDLHPFWELGIDINTLILSHIYVLREGVRKIITFLVFFYY